MGQRGTGVPAKAIDKEAHGEGADDAAHREDRNGDGPQRGECRLGDACTIAVEPRFIVEGLDDLPAREQGEA